MRRRDFACVAGNPERLDFAKPESIAITAEQVAAVMQSLDQLDDLSRLSIILYYLEDLTMFEISRSLGLNEGTVTRLVRNALTNLHGKILT